jgi:hypothetical protein
MFTVHFILSLTVVRYLKWKIYELILIRIETLKGSGKKLIFKKNKFDCYNFPLQCTCTCKVWNVWNFCTPSPPVFLALGLRVL